MDKLKATRNKKQARANRVKATIRGTDKRPRLNVFISHRHVSAQIIDDEKHQTIAAVTTAGQKSLPENLTEKATWAGSEIAKRAQAVKVNKVVFDRSSRLYHGRIKALAEAARKSELEF